MSISRLGNLVKLKSDKSSKSESRATNSTHRSFNDDFEANESRVRHTDSLDRMNNNSRASSTNQRSIYTDESSLSMSWNDSKGKRKTGGSMMSESQNDIVDAMLDAMNNEKMNDVTILGRDGARIRAIKYVLACQSAVMQEKLYTNPPEQEVFIGNYGVASILALKHYCHTGSLEQYPIFQLATTQSIRGLVELVSLASTYKFDALAEIAFESLMQLLESNPWYATLAYSSVDVGSASLEELIVQFIKNRSPHLLLKTMALEFLETKHFESLLNALMGTDGSRTFLYLKRWIELNGETKENLSFAKRFSSQKLYLKSLMRDQNLIPDLIESNFFDNNEIYKILSQDQADGPRKTLNPSSSKPLQIPETSRSTIYEDPHKNEMYPALSVSQQGSMNRKSTSSSSSVLKSNHIIPTENEDEKIVAVVHSSVHEGSNEDFEAKERSMQDESAMSTRSRRKRDDRNRLKQHRRTKSHEGSEKHRMETTKQPSQPNSNIIPSPISLIASPESQESQATVRLRNGNSQTGEPKNTILDIIPLPYVEASLLKVRKGASMKEDQSEQSSKASSKTDVSSKTEASSEDGEGAIYQLTLSGTVKIYSLDTIHLFDYSQS